MSGINARHGMSGPLRDRHTVSGRVQGVGFRPFVYRLAVREGLTGFVLNAPEGVVIEVQGPQEALDRFAVALRDELPPLAMLVTQDRQAADPLPEESGFSIRATRQGEGHHVLVSPDVAVCPDCLADMADPANRRHDYPFTNCTNCGPRYTITRSLPYDRATTSMACFPMCPDCQAEYDDPMDRRFHAQPNACAVCGPRLWLTDASGKRLAEGQAALDAAARQLARGRVLAMKGLGGFHLAVDACNPDAVDALRTRKNRPDKPLAVMVPDVETLERLARVDQEERAMLSGQERPIVLVPLNPDHPLAPGISPDTAELGAMLPYTPLHHVLLARFRTGAPDLPAPAVPALVMTSGNASSEPICLGNREALARLGGIADVFLLHDRDILVRTDDSVVRYLDLPDGGRGVQFLRRARGFTPSPVFLDRGGPCVLGVGPELKNTICLTKGDQAFLSQHIGDMHNLETAAFHKEVVAHLADILRVTPQTVVADLHPDYLSTRYALEESGLPVLRLQHHFAHVFALLAEHRLDQPVLGIALDGSGYGLDGTIWGGELLYVDPRNVTMRRVGHFAPVRLPGGEAAIRQPWRMAVSCLHALGRDPLAEGWPWLAGREQAATLVRSMIDKGVNSPVTTSCGRLFDAVSALAGLCGQINYEGQAAIRLQQAQDPAETGAYALTAREDGQGMLVLDTLGLFGRAADDLLDGASPGAVAARFHEGLARGLADAARNLCARLGVTRVGLSGGVFHNATLSVRLAGLLNAAGLTPLIHAQTPPGDGCIALGQAFYGVLQGDSAE